MKKQELIEKLKSLQAPGDPEIAHGMADRLLLDYIDDDEVTKAFNDIEKWYA